MVLCLALPEFLFPSSPYMPPAKNTINAPISVPGDSLFPNNQILNKRLTSFRTFSTIVTVNADAADARRFTPRMQAYWVNTFMTRYASWLGIRMVVRPFCSSGGRFEIDSYAGNPKGGEAASLENCLAIDGKKGMNSGSESRCE